MTQPAQDKGKGKARAPRETDPLLPSASYHHPRLLPHDHHHHHPSATSSTRSGSHSRSRSHSRSPSPRIDRHHQSTFSTTPSHLKSHLLTLLWILLTLLVAVTLFLCLLASSYAPALQSLQSDDERLLRSLEWRGPENLRLLNISQVPPDDSHQSHRDEHNRGASGASALWIEASGFVGIDTDSLLAFEKEWDGEAQLGWWERHRRKWARQAIDTFHQANVTFPSSILISSSDSSHSRHLFSLTPSPSHLLIPLTPRLQSSEPPIFPPHPRGPNHHLIPSWLTPVTLQFRVDLLGEPTELIEVAKRAWAKQSIDVEASLAKVNVSGVGKWLSLIHRAQKGVKMKLSVPIPRVPSLPTPPPTNLTDLIHLVDFSVHRSLPSPNNTTSRKRSQPRSNRDRSQAADQAHSFAPDDAKLLVDATASMPNVLLGIVGHFPFELEFDIGVVLPDESAGDENGEVGLSEDRQSSGRPGEMRQSGFLEEEAKKRENTRNVIARVHTKPIFLHPTAKNITVFVTGEILPPPSTPSPPSSASTLSVATAGDDIIPLTNTETPLASFVRSYLASTPLPLLLTHVRTPSSSTPKPISDLLALVTPLEFPIPPPDPPIHLIRSVTIEGMKVGTSKDGKTILASGTVRAEAQIPEKLIGKDGLSINVQRVLPNVLVYNGPVPPASDPPSSSLSLMSTSYSVHSDHPFTSNVISEDPPLPPTAFARLHPLDPIPAFTHPDPTDPTILLLRAPFKDLPLEIVSDAQLRRFIAKILVKGGAAAGIEGVCDVGVLVEGLGGRVLDIGGVEVEGEVWIGRQ